MKILVAEFKFHGFIAALTKIDIRGAHIDEEVFASMNGVAPEGCEVLWE